MLCGCLASCPGRERRSIDAINRFDDRSAGCVSTNGPALDLSRLNELDSGRYHSVWLPDHMVSFWPDSLWTAEFTDLASASPSPHRHLDGLAAAAAVLTEKVPIVSAVVDTVRRHPALLAQTALTIDHLARGRFILGLGSGESENTLPYGFDFSRPVSRFEEALRVIRLLWESDGPVDFDGQFYSLHQARLDTEPYEGRFPPIWIGASGPRMLEITGRHADGWWPAGAWTPEHYAEMLSKVRTSAERAGRDPMAITPCFIQVCLIGEDDDALAKILRAPLVKAFLLQVSAETLRGFGFAHPMGERWRGFQDIDPAVLTRERIIGFLDNVRPEMILAAVPHGTPRQVAKIIKTYVDAGLRVPKILDYGAMAGLKYAESSATNVRAAEDELMRLCGDLM